ncbi:MAG: hypothetical protein M1482_05245, partial [Chloroflexi bacterium]|nr:hypothetical protein [Chloroflexota bacterium]
VAQTLDFLGMATALGGAFVEGMQYFPKAFPLLREIDDRQRLVSGLTTLGLRGLNYESEITVLPSREIEEAQADVTQALSLAREIGLRPAEAFALIVLALCQASRGDFDAALNSAGQAARIAEAIGHRQWLTFSLGVLGEIHAELFALERARQYLERAFALAHEIGSLHWIRTLSGFLSSLYLRQGDRTRAQAVLDSAPRPNDPPQTLGQRLVYASRAELALANDNPQGALDIADQLIAHAEHGVEPDGRNIFRVTLQRGQALALLGRTTEAEAALQAARDLAEIQGAVAMLWKVHVALGCLYRSAGREAESESSFSAARSIVRDLATRIGDAWLKQTWSAGANEWIDAAAQARGR